MDLQAIVIGQLTDIFRIGMLVFLALTSLNTAAATATRAGRAVPLVLGVLFIAVLIPVTFSREDPDLLPRILLGIPVNTILLGVILAALTLWKRTRN